MTDCKGSVPVKCTACDSIINNIEIKRTAKRKFLDWIRFKFLGIDFYAYTGTSLCPSCGAKIRVRFSVYCKKEK